jgi:hypothetical protein
MNRGGPRNKITEALCSSGFRELAFSLIPLFFLVLAAVFMYDWQEVSKEETSLVLVRHSIGSLRDNVAAYFAEKTRIASYLQQLVLGGIWTDPSDLRQYASHIIPILSLHSSYKAVDAAVGDLYDVSISRPPQGNTGYHIRTDLDQHFHLLYSQGMYTRTHDTNFMTTSNTFSDWTRGPNVATNYDPYTELWIQKCMDVNFMDWMYEWTMPFLGGPAGKDRMVSMYFKAQWPFTHYPDATDTITSYFSINYKLATLRDIASDVPDSVHVAVFNRYTGRVIVYNKRDDVDTVTLWNLHDYFQRAANVSSFFSNPETGTAMIMYDDMRLEVSSLKFTYSDDVQINFNQDWLIITASPNSWANHRVVAHSITRFFQQQYELRKSLKFLVTARLLDDVFDVISYEKLVIPALISHEEVDRIQITTLRHSLRFYRSGDKVVTEVHHNFPTGILDPLYQRNYYRLTLSSGTPVRFDDWGDNPVVNYPVNARNALWYKFAVDTPNWSIRWLGPWDLTDEATNRYTNLSYHSFSLVFRVPWPRAQLSITNDATQMDVKFRFEFTIAELASVLDRLDVGTLGAAALITANGQIVAISGMANRPYVTSFPPAPIWAIPEFRGMDANEFYKLLRSVPCATCTLFNDTNRGIVGANGRRIYGMSVTDTFYLFISLSDDLLTQTEISDKVTLGGLVFFVFILMIVNGIYFVYNVRNIVMMDMHLLHLARHNPSGVKGLKSTNLSTNNEVRRVERAILKMKAALETYMAYLPHADVAEQSGTGKHVEEESVNLMSHHEEHETTEMVAPARRYSVTSVSRSLDVDLKAVNVIFVSISIHNLLQYTSSPAFDAFFKKVSDFVCPIVKLAGGQITGFHHGIITAVWDTEKRTDTLVRNVFAQAIGALLTIADDFHTDILQSQIRRIVNAEGVALTIVASAAEAVAGNIGTETTKCFAVYGRARFEADQLRELGTAMHNRYASSNSIVLVDDTCQVKTTGRLLVREVLPGKVWNPYAYDPSVMRTQDSDVRVEQYEAYKKYYIQRVNNGPLSVESDFQLVASRTADAIAKRLVMTYNDPVHHKLNIA